MLTVSYNLSATLKDGLAHLDELRKKILVIPVSPATETKMRWQTTLSHLEGWAILSNQPLTSEHILNTINHPDSKNNSQLTTKVLNYRNAINYVRDFWPANPERVSFITIKHLANILSVNHGSEKEVGTLLTYLQAGQVHPLIQAATAHLYFYPSRLSYLASLLFLTKYGYGLRGWLSLEDFWGQNKQQYLQVVLQAQNLANTTLWLEYFCQAMIFQMEKIHTALTSSPTPSSTKYWKLTQLQKDILTLLEKPDISITNRLVQSVLDISQVTASRNLARLAYLGLILPNGGGRSTSYTKA